MTHIRYFIYILFLLLGLSQIASGETCPIDEYEKEAVESADPNEILGTSGYGKENYIAKRDYLNYTVYFENDAEQASAPAQEIEVSNMVDLTKFNPNDFSFGTFTFRDITIEATQGVTEFSQDVDMRPKGENIIIRIQGTFDKTTGEVRCYMIAYDPVTMDLTENPHLGILYPNTAPPIGEGNFTYRIGLRQDLPDGTVISNKADITFDLNEPIVTNTYINTLDLSKPASSMSFVASEKSDSTFVISWSGSDTGSGVRDYTVYVSENDGDYSVWQYNTPTTSAEFTGKIGATYRFYCIATDNVGNREGTKQAEIVIQVIEKNHSWGNWIVTTPATCKADGEETKTCKNDASHVEKRKIPQLTEGCDDDTDISEISAAKLSIYPNPAKNEISIQSDLLIKKVEIHSLTGSLLITENNFTGKISVSTLSEGTYLLKVYTNKGVIIRKFVKE